MDGDGWELIESMARRIHNEEVRNTKLEEVVARLQADRDYLMRQVQALGETKAQAQREAMSVLDAAIARATVTTG